MAKYIDADEVYEQLCKEATRDSQPRAIRRAAKMVIEFPAADVAPVRHGRWIKWETNFMSGYMCSECEHKYSDTVYDAVYYGVYYRPGFCASCGAKMDKEAASDEA